MIGSASDGVVCIGMCWWNGNGKLDGWLGGGNWSAADLLGAIYIYTFLGSRLGCGGGVVVDSSSSRTMFASTAQGEDSSSRRRLNCRLPTPRDARELTYGESPTHPKIEGKDGQDVGKEYLGDAATLATSTMKMAKRKAQKVSAGSPKVQ